MDPFISRQDLSDHLGRDVTADDGATIAVNVACDMVRTMAEQLFTPLTDTVALDGSGTDFLELPERPVNNVGTVVMNGGTLVENSDYAWATDGRLFRTSGTSFTTWTNGWTWIRGGTAFWPPGRQNIVVTYEHGYDNGGADVPDDVRGVALALAARIFVQTVNAAETQGTDSKRYAANSTDFTSGEKMILDKHRRY